MCCLPTARVVFTLGLALVLAMAGWAILRVLFQVRSSAYTATKAFDTASFHSGISGQARTLGRNGGGAATTTESVTGLHGGGEETGDGDGIGRGHRHDSPDSGTSSPRVPGHDGDAPYPAHVGQRGVYSSSSSALSPNPSLQVCSPGAAYSDFLFSAGRPHSAAEDCGLLGAFVSPTEYSKGRLVPRHHFVGGGRDGAYGFGGAGGGGGNLAWGPEWETDSRLLDFQLGLHAPAEGGRLVALASDVRRHELLRWCRRLHSERTALEDMHRRGSASSFAGTSGSGTSDGSRSDSGNAREDGGVWSSSVLDLFGLEGDLDAKARVGRGVLRFLPWRYEGVYGGVLERPASLPQRVAATVANNDRRLARERNMRRARERRRKEEQEKLLETSKASGAGEEAQRRTEEAPRETVVVGSRGELEGERRGQEEGRSGDNGDGDGGDSGGGDGGDSGGGDNDDDDDDDDDGAIVMDLDAETDDFPSSPTTPSTATATQTTSAQTDASAANTESASRPQRTFLGSVHAWWFWRSRLLFDWILPGVLSDPDEVVERVRATTRAQHKKEPSSSDSPDLAALDRRLNMRLASPMLSGGGSAGTPSYEGLLAQSLQGDTIFPGSAMIFGQRERLLHLTRSRRALPPLWPLLLAKSPALHRFYSTAMMTLLSHRYTISALPSPREQVGPWSRSGTFYGLSHMHTLFNMAMAGGGAAGSGSDMGVLSHALYGSTISVWINVSFVVGKDSATSKPSARSSRAGGGAASRSSTTTASDAAFGRERRSKRGRTKAPGHGGFTRGDGFYSIDGTAQGVLRDVGDVLLDAAVLRTRKCANPTASNQRRWREVLWWTIAPEERWGREACPRSRHHRGGMLGGRQSRGLEWDERIDIPGYAWRSAREGNDGEDRDGEDRDGEDRDGVGRVARVSRIWVDPSPVDRFHYDLHPHARVSAVIMQKNPDTGAQDMFDARNCGPACDAIWPDVGAEQREEDVYGGEEWTAGKTRQSRTRKKSRKKRSRIRALKGRSVQLTLWQLRRFVAVWREMVDRPERFGRSTLETDASRRLTGMRSVTVRGARGRQSGRGQKKQEVILTAPRIVGVRASVPLVYGMNGPVRHATSPFYSELMQGTLSAMVALFMWTGNLTWYLASFLSSTLHSLFQEPHAQGGSRRGGIGGDDSDGPRPGDASSSSSFNPGGDSSSDGGYVLPPCEVKSPELGFWSSDGDFGLSGSTFSPPNLTCHNWEVLPVAATTCVIVSVPQLPTLSVLINTFAVSMFVTAFVSAFLCYLAFGHILLNTTARHGWGLPGWVRTISVTAHFTLVYFAPNFEHGGGDRGLGGRNREQGGTRAGSAAARAGGAAPAPAVTPENAGVATSANADGSGDSAEASGSSAGAASLGAAAPAEAAAEAPEAAAEAPGPTPAPGSTREQLIRQFSAGGNNDDS